LHFGSLVAALASWLDARSHHGAWLVRLEDLDRARTLPGTADDILRALEFCGLEWDGSVVFQSARTEDYASALASLRSDNGVFVCGCSRREIADSAIRTGTDAIYPGTCRNGLPAGRSARSWRVRIADGSDGVISFMDAVQGRVRQDLTGEVGDFIVKRADGPFAYQLAVVVDDAEQGITHVVRGADLLDSTPRQIYLQQLLGLPVPRHAHVPAAINAQGEKLSKQTRARALRKEEVVCALHSALRFLGQRPPPELVRAPASELLAWARAHWSLDLVPKERALAAPAAFRSF